MSNKTFATVMILEGVLIVAVLAFFAGRFYQMELGQRLRHAPASAKE